MNKTMCSVTIVTFFCVFSKNVWTIFRVFQSASQRRRPIKISLRVRSWGLGESYSNVIAIFWIALRTRFSTQKSRTTRKRTQLDDLSRRYGEVPTMPLVPHDDWSTENCRKNSLNARPVNWFTAYVSTVTFQNVMHGQSERHQRVRVPPLQACEHWWRVGGAPIVFALMAWTHINFSRVNVDSNPAQSAAQRCTTTEIVWDFGSNEYPISPCWFVITAGGHCCLSRIFRTASAPWVWCSVPRWLDSCQVRSWCS